MNRVYNLIRELTDKRRKTKDGKIALAVYIGIKFSHVNSLHKGISIKEIKRFFGVGHKTAIRILNVMREDKELFTINEKKNCVFANCCKSDEIKLSKKHGYQYRSDDVIKIDVPECYSSDNMEERKMPLRKLILLLERVLILKEYDKGYGYKSGGGGRKTEKDPNCENPEPKSQVYVSKRTGISRSTLQRRLKDYEKDGIIVKTSERHFERVAPHSRYSFQVVNKRTKLPMWLRCMPAAYDVINAGVAFTHVIWDAAKRLHAVACKSEKRIREEVLQSCAAMLSPDELNLRIMAERQLAIRDAWD